MSNMNNRGFLTPYRVLDVTDFRGLLAGQILAQLGADVVQMESAKGCNGRRQPPYCSTWRKGDDSLYWAAYASGKRSIICNPATDPEIWVVSQFEFRCDR